MSPRGGTRAGAGRPKGEPTKAVRVPVSLLAELERLKEGSNYQLPVFSTSLPISYISKSLLC